MCKTQIPVKEGEDRIVVETKILLLYQIIDELRTEYPEKRFALDGVLLGNLGEVYAEEHYAIIGGTYGIV